VNKLVFFKNMSAEYATLAAMLNHLCTTRKPLNPNQIIFFSDEKILYPEWKDKQPE
jgi:hypothetical protein